MNHQETLEVPVNEWEEYTKPEFIKGLIFYICEDITMKGEKSRYKDAYDELFLHIEENFDKYYPDTDTHFDYLD